MMARDLGKVNYFTAEETRQLLDLKKKWGFKDPRNEGMQNCDICANDIFRDSWKSTGVERRAFEPPPPMKPAANADAPVDQEALVKLITDRVLAALKA
jgi:L-fuculose-phosphate aldolase